MWNLSIKLYNKLELLTDNSDGLITQQFPAAIAPINGSNVKENGTFQAPSKKNFQLNSSIKILYNF